MFLRLFLLLRIRFYFTSGKIPTLPKEKYLTVLQEQQEEREPSPLSYNHFSFVRILFSQVPAEFLMLLGGD